MIFQYASVFDAAMAKHKTENESRMLIDEIHEMFGHELTTIQRKGNTHE